MTRQEQLALLQSIERLLSGTLEVDQVDVLRDKLSVDIEALECFVDAVALDVDLERCFFRDGDQVPAGVISDVALILPTSLPHADAPLKQEPPGRIPLAAKSARPIRFYRSWMKYAAAVAFFLYGTFAIIAWDMLPMRWLGQFGNSHPAVATLSNSSDVSWSNATTGDQCKSPLPSGKHLRIESGTAEVTFDLGAIAIIEGPADFELVSANSGALNFGKVFVQVPEAAKGFAIVSPTATIVDLGTEFSVETDKAGATEVQVYRGNVEVHPGKLRDTQSASPQTYRLSAGEASRIEHNRTDGKTAVRRIVAKPRPEPKSVQTNAPRRIAVSGAVASSEVYGCSPQHLVDGSGVNGDRHSADPDEGMTPNSYNMWMSNYGRIKNEYVLFDLGRPYLLDQMKVWNFNDGRNGLHLTRGLKQADIYLSTNGVGNPLTHPSEWQLVEGNRVFRPAPGTKDYDSPEVVDLKQSTARFVAIVVDDHFGLDRPGATDTACVGISEVQFFGKRLNQNR